MTQFFEVVAYPQGVNSNLKPILRYNPNGFFYARDESDFLPCTNEQKSEAFKKIKYYNEVHKARYMVSAYLLENEKEN